VGALNNVVLRLGALRVTGKASFLAKTRKVLAPGQELVNIGLVPGIPDEGISRGIKNSVQSDGQLNHTEVWAQVPTGLCNFGDEELAYLSSQLVELGGTQNIQVPRGGY
jgi:hypothetical protein